MLPHFDSSAVLSALAEFDQTYRKDDAWMRDGRQKHALAHDGKLYPPKQVVSIITGQLSGFDSSEARRRLREVGFSTSLLSTAADAGWEEFVRWTKRIADESSLIAEEREYKLPIIENVRTAREAFARGDADWQSVLKSAFASPNNLTPWIMHDTFLKWCAQEPDAAAGVLRALWTSEAEAMERLDAFCAALPQHLITRALRVTLGSFLLMSEDPALYPIYRETPFARSFKATGFPGPEREAMPSAVYSNALEFIDRLMEEAEEVGLELGDRLEAQGAIWGVIYSDLNQEPFNKWSSSDREAIKRFRGEALDGPYWWVNQGSTFGQESAGGYVWAPQRNAAGRVNGHHANVSKLRAGHRVLHYEDGLIRALGIVTEDAEDAPRPKELPEGPWEVDGRYAKVQYQHLEAPIALADIPVEWRVAEANPFNSTGGVNQGYMFPLSRAFVQKLAGRFSDQLEGWVIDGMPEQPTLDIPDEILVVGAGGPEVVAAGLAHTRESIDLHGESADWWGYPLQPSHEELLTRSPFLYYYVSAPTSKIAYRAKVEEFLTSHGTAGIESPWPEITEPSELGQTRRGDQAHETFKSWLRVSEIIEIDPPLDPRDFVRHDGTEATPASLRGGFGLWRRRVDSPSSLSDLAAATHMKVAELEEVEALLREKRQIVLEGPPGSGKTYLARLFANYFTGSALTGPAHDKVEVVQFHQSYGYEEFIQGIRPTTVDGQMRYDLQPGVFKTLCSTAQRNPDRRFVLIIDEINRGNISRIFGELLYLLEYRDQAVRLGNASPDDPPFAIPENVYLIGTMNTTDRSLSQIDYALRRRFYFYRLMPIVAGAAPVLDSWLRAKAVSDSDRERLLRLFVALNARITENLGEHFQIGHSYFMRPGIESQEVLQQVWRRGVMPLVEEYFHNRRDLSAFLDGFRVERLLGDAGSAD